MTKSAATEAALGTLHAKVASVFQMVLEGYERRLEMVSRMQMGEFEDEMVRIKELGLDPLDFFKEPTPAMLAAITKFLKDNEISADPGEIEGLQSVSERIKAKRDRSRKVVELHSVPLTGTDDG